MSTAFAVGRDICAVVGAWFIVACAAAFAWIWARQAYQRRYLRRMETLGHLPRTYWKEGQE